MLSSSTIGSPREKREDPSACRGGWFMMNTYGWEWQGEMRKQNHEFNKPLREPT
ncbi:hypothetical protein HaloA020_09100 [Halomonas sp. A020]|nr:hypothetical protein HaloA020_09100 [Halomonas sp. A020]